MRVKWPRLSIGKFITAILDKICFYLGLYGMDNKTPSNKRVVWTVVIFSLTASFIVLVARTVALGKEFTETMSFYGLGLMAGAAGHFIWSQKQQIGAQTNGNGNGNGTDNVTTSTDIQEISQAVMKG